MIYSAKVLDHFHRPRNAGQIPGASIAIEAANPVCGDLLKLWVIVREGTISDAKFQVEGCIPAVACASLLTEMLIQRPVTELRTITAEQIEAALGGLPAASRHAAALAMAGVRELLEQLS